MTEFMAEGPDETTTKGLEEIRTKICDLRSKVEELQEDAHQLWIGDVRGAQEAAVLADALEDIAAALTELENEEED